MQQEQVKSVPNYPLPTEYWTRPIEGENTAWATIASNWLGGSSSDTYNVQPDGIAPNSPHIMWSKLLEFGGVVGGNKTGIQGMTYYGGESYEQRFSNPLIIQGRLYYPLPQSNGGSGGGYVCVDMQTGETLWWQNFTVNPTFGQLEWFDSPNQHGIIPSGYLWATSGTTWMAYNPLNGNWLFNITDVPSGTRVYGPNGELLIYQLNVANKWLALWNFTQVITNGTLSALAMTGYRPVNTVINSTQRAAYSWNVTLPTLSGSGWSISRATDNLILCIQGSLGAVGNSAGANMTAISIKPASRGQMLWMKYYPAAPNNITRSLGPVDTVNRVFTMADKETMQWSGYSMDDGSLLWGPVGNPRGFEYYSSSIASYNAGAYSTAYGKLYICGFGGLLYCYDTKTGKLLWTYGNGGSGNSTFSGIENAWGYYPIFISNIADGKVYLFTNEHSPNSPYYKDSRIRCINATTGKELWTVLSWVASTSFYAYGGYIADGYLAYHNVYDGQIYCIGKGPSATTVQAPLTAITAGNSVVIQGTVTDIAAGTEQDAIARRFPNGVSAVSDASMGQWMEYVYMQKGRPANATGVDVTLDAVDPNGNFIHLGTAMSDASGLFHYAWKTPDVPGEYTVIATFEGSESYWASYAETAIVVSEAPAATPTPPAAAPQPPFEMYFIATAVAIIIAIAIVGIMLYRKHP